MGSLRFIKANMPVVTNAEYGHIKIAMIDNRTFIAGAFFVQVFCQHVGNETVLRRHIGMLIEVVIKKPVVALGIVFFQRDVFVNIE